MKMMSTYYSLIVYECQKEICTCYSMHKHFIVATCIEVFWIITIICVMTEEQNITLDWIMCSLPTCGKSEVLGVLYHTQK